MPPFSEQPSPLPPFQSQTPPGIRPEEPKGGGMDQQTRNTIMFAVIFSVLAAGILLFIFLKPESKTSGVRVTGDSATTSATQQATTTAPKKKGFFSSFFNLSFSPSTFIPQGEKSDVFGSPNTQTSKTNTSSTPTKQTTAATKTPDPTTVAPTDKLVGIYSELPSAEAQLDLQFYEINIPSSPLRGKIWISSVKRSTNAGQEYIVLSTNKELPPGTRVTDMTIKSVVTGQTIQIGKGSNLPVTNGLNTYADIYIDAGQKILVNTGSSPLGYSFRINKCTGYFEQYQNFIPSLPRSCPLLKSYPRPAPPNHLQDPCLDYVDRFSRCTIVTSLPKTYADKLNDEQEYRCLAFIQENTGYQNCVRLHQQDKDFFTTEWRTFLSRGSPLWKSRREVIWLLDQEGKFISQYSY